MLQCCRAVASCSGTLLRRPVLVHCRAARSVHPRRHSSNMGPALEVFDKFAHAVSFPRMWEVLQSSSATKFFEAAAVFGHDSMGLPWWASVCSLAVAMRLCFVPLRVLAERVSARRLALEHSTNKLVHAAVAGRSTQQGWSPTHLQQMSGGLSTRKLRTDASEEGLSTFRLFLLNTISVPFWLFSTLAVRNLCNPAAGATSFRPDLSRGGCLWFGDLLQPEPLPVKVLPVMVFALTYLQTRAVGSRQLVPAGAPLSLKCFVAFRKYNWLVMGLIILSISAYLPACLPLYWLVSVGLTVGVNLCLQHPSFKRVLGIGPMSTDCRTPLRRALMHALVPPRFRQRLAVALRVDAVQPLKRPL